MSRRRRPALSRKIPPNRSRCTPFFFTDARNFAENGRPGAVVFVKICGPNTKALMCRDLAPGGIVLHG